MRIVLSGYYGFDNVGDEAILYAIIHALKEYHPQIIITVLSNNPQQTSVDYGVEAVNRWKLKEVYDALKQSDGLISGGGSLLQDETSSKSIPYYAGVIKIATFLKKPVFVYAQGMGPFKNKLNRWLVRHTLQSVTLLTVRDIQSKELLQSIGITRTIDIVPDPVIGIDTSAFQSNWKALMELNDPILSVSIRKWSDDLNYLNKVAEALDELSLKGYRIVLVPMHGEHDYKTSKKVESIMKQPVLISDADSSIQEKIAIIKSSSILIGMRLHALIFASITSTPFVALSYDPKVDSFAAIVDQKVVGNVNEQNWTAEDIVQSVETLQTNHQTEVTALNEKVIPLKKTAKNTALKVIDYLAAPYK